MSSVGHLSIAGLVGAALCALGGCAAESRLRGELGALREMTNEAESRGARECAPLSLAVARAHIEFATRALSKGRRSEANYHQGVAEPNARVALRLSSAEECGGTPTPVTADDRDGDGIADDVDQCPDAAEDADGWEDADGCPEDQDVDGDGIPESRDQCELEAEDSDGYLDEDGCPEPDNDLDRVLDAEDQCPLEAEDPDGHADEDGCPDPDNDADGILDPEDRCPSELGPVDNGGCPRAYENVRVTTRAIRIDQEVFFQTSRARVRPVSFPLLDTVAQVLRDFPEMTVEIQGHTDNRGSDRSNMRLSSRRAEAVRDYLVSRGIVVSRLTSRGYGETRPIETNRTAEGRASNRRVEFVRTDQPPEGQ